MTLRSRTSLRLLKWFVGLVLAAFTAGVLAVAAVYITLAQDLPDIEQLRDVEFQEPLRVYSAEGDLLAEYGSQRRIPLALEDIPEQMRQAFIAAEDERFYTHPGVDVMGLTRAAINLAQTGTMTQGGSTITMQVARNFFLTRERTFVRKFREIFLALKMERELTKDEILELYLNKIFLGQRAYGVGAAAQTYFGKSVHDLTLAETALIAGLPTAPSRYNPVASPRHAEGRRSYVLRRMHSLGLIDQDAYETALATPVSTSVHRTPVAAEASYVGEMARLEAAERFGEDVYTGGYRVFTTVRTDEQRAAVDSLRGSLLAYERRQGFTGPVGRLDVERLPTIEDLEERIALPGVDVVEEADGEIRVIEHDEGYYGPFELDDFLAEHGRFGNLEPAVVIAVGDEAATLYLRRGRISPMAFETMEWARPRREGGGRGSAPEAPGDVVEPGDIVYVEPAGDGQVALAQAPAVQGALVALDPRDGSIRALMGGYDFNRSKFNRVTQARRQPGSAFKPFIFSAALEHGYSASTLVNDAPVVFDDPALEDTWRPENYSGRVFGPTPPARSARAFAQSRVDPDPAADGHPQCGELPRALRLSVERAPARSHARPRQRIADATAGDYGLYGLRQWRLPRGAPSHSSDRGQPRCHHIPREPGRGLPVPL
jgi:penicillin-binding protein 1A